jgi:uncharacterized protein (TIGR02271 family)
MKSWEAKTVTDQAGLSGTIETTLTDSIPGGGSQVLVRLDNGERILAPSEALELQEDGSYRLPFSIAELDRAELDRLEDDVLVVPVLAETLNVEKREVEAGGVRVIKRVHEREEIIDEPLLEEALEVQRVPVSQVVDGPLSIRYEGNTIIIPLVEEVLVVEKRLMLKEEIHITRRRGLTHKPQPVTLRSEEAVVEQIETNRKEN